LLRCFLNDFLMVSIATIIIGIAFVFTFHMLCIYIVRFYILESSHSFPDHIPSPEIASSIIIHVRFS
jgi:Na+-transporting methylmalonyl-CoA/oxaloacetate decarboxylase gamma subunit